MTETKPIYAVRQEKRLQRNKSVINEINRLCDQVKSLTDCIQLLVDAATLFVNPAGDGECTCPDCSKMRQAMQRAAELGIIPTKEVDNVDNR